MPEQVDLEESERKRRRVDEDEPMEPSSSSGSSQDHLAGGDTQREMDISAVNKLMRAGLSKEEIRFVVNNGTKPASNFRRKTYGKNEQSNQKFINNISQEYPNRETMAQRLRQIPGFIIDFTKKSGSNKK